MLVVERHLSNENNLLIENNLKAHRFLKTAVWVEPRLRNRPIEFHQTQNLSSELFEYNDHKHLCFFFVCLFMSF